MATRRAVLDRIHRPTGLRDIADSPGEPERLPEYTSAAPPAVERYLGNGYLEAVARGGRHSAASPARRAGPDDRAGEARGLASSSSATVQAKLVVGAAGDACEREADRVADLLMRRAGARALADGSAPEQPHREDAPVRVSQRTSRGLKNGIDLPSEIAARLERTLAGGGFPLPERERALFESLLGVNLGSVRIHTSPAATQTARALDARAYAIGSEIAFGSGQYRPGTDSGRWLLAHELVHTVQQQGAGPGPAECSSVQCNGGGRIVAEEDRPIRGTWSWGYLTVTHDIQWHWDLMGINAGNVESLELFIDVPRIARHGKPLSARNVAALSVAILMSQGGVRFKDGTGQAFFADVTGRLQRYKFADTDNWTLYSYDLETLQDYIDPQLLRELGDRFRQVFRQDKSNLLPLVAKVDYVDPEKLRAADQARRLEQWAEGKEATIRKLIEQARKQKPRPQDLPDKVAARKGTKDWYLRVWVNYDQRGKKQATQIVRLRENESDEALFQRVRAATTEALFRDEDREKREREKDFPAWAKAKKRAVEEALGEQRRRDKGKDDFPDGIVLVAERQAAGPAPDENAPAAPNTVDVTRTSSEGAPPVKVSEATVPLATGSTELPSYIYLQVWVERRSGKGYQRNTGTVPLPLRPDTNVEELVRYIRTLVTLLRQYEMPPAGQPTSPARSPEKTLPSAQALRAFPAVLAPADLPEDGITVSGARNEFHMQLDYEDVYGGGELKDLFIASKLFSQYIRFYWKLFKVPAEFKQQESAGASDDWRQRLSYLYGTLNATGQPYPDARWDNAKYFNESVDTGWSDDDTDSKMRVKFPEMDETKDPPEDFIVYCETRHGPIGDEELKRVSSIAYYPVHVKPIKTVAKAAVSGRTQRIEMIERELEMVRAKLNEEQLDETYQQVLRAVEQMKVDELKRLRDLETKKPAEGIQAELSYIDGMLPKLKLIQEAREEGRKKGTAPSKLLENQPELLVIHMWLLAENRDLEAYANQLKWQRDRLADSAKVADTFKDDIKADSPHQYNAEAAMISTLTGLVYPLRLLIAEAPDKRKRFRGGVAYTVIDATSPETQDQYQGDWPSADSAGHLKAIQKGLDDFGDDATYGEGLIVVRIPSPPPGRERTSEAGGERAPKPAAEAHPGPALTYHESSPGPLQLVLKALAIIALVAGAVALSLTGAGAPAAAALLGFIAASAGAIQAVQSMRQRSRRHKFEWDAETALDIVSIVSVIPAGIGAKFALQASALARTNPGAIPAWLQSVERAQRLLRIYSATEMGGSLYLVHEKLEDDIKKIELLAERMKLAPDEKRKLRDQAFSAAMTSGVMMVGGAVAAHIGAATNPRPSSFVETERLQQQADLLELEGLPRGYQSLQERNVLDVQGELTPAGRGFIDRIVPGATKRLAPSGAEPPPPPPPAIARPAVESAKPAEVPAAAAAQQKPRGSGREAAEVRAKPVAREAGPADVETAAQKGGPKRRPQKRDVRAAEEGRVAEPPAVAEPEPETGKGAAKKRPGKREPSREERRPVSGKKPPGPPGGPTPGPVPAPQGVSLRSSRIWHFDGRDVVIVDTPRGPLAFYRRTGWGSLGERGRGGAQKGDWAPFEGFYAGQLVKPEDLGEGSLRRWSTAEHREIAQWLKSLNLPKGEDVGDAWSVIQRNLEDAGVTVRYPQYGGQGAAAPTEPPPPPGTTPPTGPQPPPRPPAAPPPGGGGGGPGGPPGLRPLTQVEAEYHWRHLERPAEYDRRMILDPDIYEAAWRAAAGPQGGDPPPHGYLDHNQRVIVVYRPRSGPQAAPPTGPGRPPGSMPPGPGGAGGAGSAPTRLSPAQGPQSAPREGEGSQPAFKGEAPSAPPPPRQPGPDVPGRVMDPEDLPGTIARSEAADPDHYFAREYLGDVRRFDDLAIQDARYYVEAHLEDGIVEMDFVLRRNDIPGIEGYRRSSQLRGQEEFTRALNHFRGIHGETGIKGIKGDWGGGDNLDRFNEAFKKALGGGAEWNQALRQAALETHTGTWAGREGFSEVRIQSYSASSRGDDVAFDHVIVIFHKPGASGSGMGGGPGPPPAGQGPPKPPEPVQSSAGQIGAMTRMDRPPASRSGAGGRTPPPSTAQAPPAPSPPSPSPPSRPPSAPAPSRGPIPASAPPRPTNLHVIRRRQPPPAQPAPAAPSLAPQVTETPARPTNVHVIRRREPPAPAQPPTAAPRPVDPAAELPPAQPTNIHVIRRQQPPGPAQPAPTVPRPAAPDRTLDPTGRPAQAIGPQPPVTPAPEPPTRARASEEPDIPPPRARDEDLPRARAPAAAEVGEAVVRPRLRTPEELPRPRGVNTPQEFGEEVIMWGAGRRGAEQRLAELDADPEGYREHLTHDPERTVTVEMAEAWRDHYQNEFERSRELAYERGDPRLVNATAAARARLMDRIATLLAEPPRPGLIARLRDFVRRRDPGRRTMAGLVQPPVGGRPSRAAVERASPADRAPEPPTPGGLRHQAWVDEILRSGLEPGLPEITIEPQGSLRRGTYRADIEIPEEAYQVYLEALARSGGREVQIFRNRVTDRYAVQVGDEFEVHRPMRGDPDDWEGVLHYHHDPEGKNVLVFRMPAPADVRAAQEDSRAAGGVTRTEFVEYPIPGIGRGRVAYTVRRDVASGTEHITIRYVHPDGQRVTRHFSSLEQYQTEYTSRTFHVDPVRDRNWIEWLVREILSAGR